MNLMQSVIKIRLYIVTNLSIETLSTLNLKSYISKVTYSAFNGIISRILLHANAIKSTSLLMESRET